MQIVVLANEELKNELLSGGAPLAEVHWIESLEEASEFPSAEALIDLLFETEHLAALQSIDKKSILINSVEKVAGSDSMVRFNGWPSLLSGTLIEATGAKSLQPAAEEVFRQFHKTIEWLPDQHGFVTARVISMIISEAYRALEEGVSSEEDINTAMKLGTNYPYGPFEWANKIGSARIASLLRKMGEEKAHYTPASLLSH